MSDITGLKKLERYETLLIEKRKGRKNSVWERC